MLTQIILAVTNITIIPLLISTWNHGDLFSFEIFGFLGFFSFISHLLMCHKHYLQLNDNINQVLSSFNINPNVLSRWLNYLDVVGCILTTGRLMNLMFYSIDKISWNNHLFLILNTLLLLIINQISERCNGKLYLILHAIWHITIYLILNQWYLILHF